MEAATRALAHSNSSQNNRSPSSLRERKPRKVESLAAAFHYRHKFLDPLRLLHFAREDVSIRVDPDGIDPVELARIFAVSPERSEGLAALAIKNPHVVVRSVGYIHIFLIRIFRENHLVGSSTGRHLCIGWQAAAILPAGRRIGRHVEFLHELSFFCEHLDSVLAALADIN